MVRPLPTAKVAPVKTPAPLQMQKPKFNVPGIQPTQGRAQPPASQGMQKAVGMAPQSALAKKPVTPQQMQLRNQQRRDSAARGRAARGQPAAPGAPASPMPAAAGQQMDFSTPQGILNAQAQYNDQYIKQQQQANWFNEANPYGSKEFIQNPDGSFTKKTSLSDPQQQILNASQQNEIGAQGAFGDALGVAQNQVKQGLDYSGLLSVDPANEATRKQYEQALINKQLKLLQPQFDQQKEAAVANLRNRGIQFGSPEYNKQMKLIEDQQSSQLADIANNATLSSGQEAAQMFQNQLALQGQQAGFAKDKFNAPLAALGQLAAVKQGVINPVFENTQGINVQGLDAQGLGMNVMNNQFATQQQAKDQAFQAKQNAIQNNLQLKLAQMAKGGGGGGGGGGGKDYAAQLDYYAQKQALDNKAQMEMMDYQAKLNKQNQPSPYGQIFSGLGSVLGQGIGAGASKYIGSLF